MPVEINDKFNDKFLPYLKLMLQQDTDLRLHVFGGVSHRTSPWWLVRNELRDAFNVSTFGWARSPWTRLDNLLLKNENNI
jgi:hypothetical protein